MFSANTLKRSLGCLCIVVAASTLAVSAQSVDDCSEPSPEIGAKLRTIVQEQKLPAMAAADVKSGRIRCNAYGNKKYVPPPRPSGTPIPADLAVNPNNQFHLGSNTKAFTAVIIAMILEGQSKFSLESTLDDFKLGKAASKANLKITIRQLLSHTSGLDDADWPLGMDAFDVHALLRTGKEPKVFNLDCNDWLKAKDEHKDALNNAVNFYKKQREKYVQLILQEDPPYCSGCYHYSNRNYAVLGAIAEELAGQSWELLVCEKIVNELHMDTCGFGSMGKRADLEKFSLEATPKQTEPPVVEITPDQPLQHTDKNAPIWPGLYADNPAAIAPAANMHCSVGDWAKFIRWYMQGLRQEKNQNFPSSIGKAIFGAREEIKNAGSSPKPSAGICQRSPSQDCRKVPYEFGWLITRKDGKTFLENQGSNTRSRSCARIELGNSQNEDVALLVMTNQAYSEKGCDDAIEEIRK